MTASALLLAAVLLLATMLLAAADTTFERLLLVRALRLREEQEGGAAHLVWLLEHRATTRHVVLTTTVHVRLGYAAAVLVAVRGVVAPVAAAALLLAAAVAVVIGEVVPRTLALRRLEQTGLALARPVRGWIVLVAPYARLLVTLGRLAAGRRDDGGGPYAEDQPDDLAPDVDEDVDIAPDERAMITSILELGGTLVREIMVPRPDMVTVDVDAELREVIETVVEHGRSRLPVVRGSGDQVIGAVHAKDVLARLATRPGSGRWRDLVRDVRFVPESKRVDRLLAELRDEGVHQAIVVDEYGDVTGLVTIEDVLEEIVGEIVDEHDDEAPMLEVLDGSRYRVDARLAVADLDEVLGVDLPHDEWDTVGGLVLGMLGQVPDEGETVELQGLRFTAERVQGRRVARVQVERVAEQHEQEQRA